MAERGFTVEDLAQAAFDVASCAALFLIREGGDGEAAIAALADCSMPVEGEEVLDAAAVAAQAIRSALEMGVMPR